eukprot:jgi/Mesen1/9512/ME000637S08960
MQAPPGFGPLIRPQIPKQETNRNEVSSEPETANYRVGNGASETRSIQRPPGSEVTSLFSAPSSLSENDLSVVLEKDGKERSKSRPPTPPVVHSLPNTPPSGGQSDGGLHAPGGGGGGGRGHRRPRGDFQLPITARTAKGPDGSRGFSIGRGKVLAPPPGPSPSAPSSLESSSLGMLGAAAANGGAAAAAAVAASERERVARETTAGGAAGSTAAAAAASSSAAAAAAAAASSFASGEGPRLKREIEAARQQVERMERELELAREVVAKQRSFREDEDVRVAALRQEAGDLVAALQAQAGRLEDDLGDARSEVGRLQHELFEAKFENERFRTAAAEARPPTPPQQQQRQGAAGPPGAKPGAEGGAQGDAAGAVEAARWQQQAEALERERGELARQAVEKDRAMALVQGSLAVFASSFLEGLRALDVGGIAAASYAAAAAARTPLPRLARTESTRGWDDTCQLLEAAAAELAARVARLHGVEKGQKEAASGNTVAAAGAVTDGREAAEVEARADALEKENLLLKQQLEEARAAVGVSRSFGRAGSQSSRPQQEQEQEQQEEGAGVVVRQGSGEADAAAAESESSRGGVAKSAEEAGAPGEQAKPAVDLLQAFGIAGTGRSPPLPTEAMGGGGGDGAQAGAGLGVVSSAHELEQAALREAQAAFEAAQERRVHELAKRAEDAEGLCGALTRDLHEAQQRCNAFALHLHELQQQHQQQAVAAAASAKSNASSPLKQQQPPPQLPRDSPGPWMSNAPHPLDSATGAAGAGPWLPVAPAEWGGPPSGTGAFPPLGSFPRGSNKAGGGPLLPPEFQGPASRSTPPASPPHLPSALFDPVTPPSPLGPPGLMRQQQQQQQQHVPLSPGMLQQQDSEFGAGAGGGQLPSFMLDFNGSHLRSRHPRYPEQPPARGAHHGHGPGPGPFGYDQGAYGRPPPFAEPPPSQHPQPGDGRYLFGGGSQQQGPLRGGGPPPFLQGGGPPPPAHQHHLYGRSQSLDDQLGRGAPPPHHHHHHQGRRSSAFMEPTEDPAEPEAADFFDSFGLPAACPGPSYRPGKAAPFPGGHPLADASSLGLVSELQSRAAEAAGGGAAAFQFASSYSDDPAHSPAFADFNANAFSAARSSEVNARSGPASRHGDGGGGGGAGGGHLLDGRLAEALRAQQQQQQQQQRGNAPPEDGGDDEAGWAEEVILFRGSMGEEV